MVKIGLVGCGKIAEKHLMGYKTLKNNQVVLYDLKTEQAKRLAQQFDCDWVSRIEGLLADSTVSAIDICTPTPTHANLIHQALQAGKHVFCEKPLTENLERTEKLQKLASTNNRILMAGYLYRFHPAFELIKNGLEENIIRKPYLAWFRLGGRGSHRLWKHQRTEGGGAINEMLVHMLDLALWYFGDLEVVASHMTTILPERETEGQIARVDAEDLVLVNLRFSTGAQLFCQSDLVTPSYMNYLEILGTEGSLFTSIFDHFPTIVFCKRPRGIYQQGNNFFHFPKTNLFEKELGYFLRCLQEGQSPELNSMEDSIKLIKLMEDIRGTGKNI